MKILSFRFDIDSLADIEAGVPRLIELGKELDARFTVFVNMGRSFNWKIQGLGKDRSSLITRHSSTIGKLGLLRTIRTVIFNPNIGLSHKKNLFRLLDSGHELGLHGGMDHPTWQWQLDLLTKDQIDDLLRPAYDHFRSLFGKPKGFGSPGFRYNRYVLELMDDYGFEYASDMEGDAPFRPEGFRHVQIPVNITGPGRRPLLEYLCASGFGEAVVEKTSVENIERKEIAVMYGHPALEGRLSVLKKLICQIKEHGYQIKIMGELADLL